MSEITESSGNIFYDLGLQADDDMIEALLMHVARHDIRTAHDDVILSLIARIRSEREQTIRECAAIAQDECDSDIAHLILALLEPKP